MALKNVYILKSAYPASSLISHLNTVGVLCDVDLAKNKVHAIITVTKPVNALTQQYFFVVSNGFVQTIVNRRCKMQWLFVSKWWPNFGLTTVQFIAISSIQFVAINIGRESNQRQEIFASMVGLMSFEISKKNRQSLQSKFPRNFLVTNKRYHTNMTSIVLCQSGLYSSAVLLASARGAHLDAYCGLVGVSNQEFGKFISHNRSVT